MQARGVILQLRKAFGVPRQTSWVNTRLGVNSMQLRPLSTTDDDTTSKNDEKRFNSPFAPQESTRKLATWLDATIIKRNGVAFEASKNLMNAGNVG